MRWCDRRWSSGGNPQAAPPQVYEMESIQECDQENASRHDQIKHWPRREGWVLEQEKCSSLSQQAQGLKPSSFCFFLVTGIILLLFLLRIIFHVEGELGEERAYPHIH